MVFECLGSLLVLNILLAAWVLADSMKRGATLTWTLGTFLMGPIILPVYRARRPLQGTEVRAGGPDWIVSRNFTWTWTLVMALIIFWTAVTLITGNGLPEFESENSQTAAEVSRLMVLLFLSVCWVVPTAGAFFFSLISFMDDDIQFGPEADSTGYELPQSMDSVSDGVAGDSSPD